ncbi:MAG: D-alanyl-D-alanine carboxypeptidase [Muribaculaceae bacterium]|nr:D-alanyl-D-alanine carboxypeptidase [Muribaculaceae bacterium]
MIHKNIRTRLRLWCTILLSIVSLTCAAVSPSEAVTRFAQTPRLPQGSMAVLVSELPSGNIVASYNADVPLTPASIMKSVTLASLSEELDVDLSLLTPVYIDGDVDEEGILWGNILIEAQGDPSINSGVWPVSEDFPGEIVSALQSLGVKRIKGAVKVDEKFLQGPSVPSSWASADLPHSYGTGSHAFNFANNSVGKSSVKDPAGVFLQELNRRFQKAGIICEGNASPLNKDKKRRLMVHASPELKEIMRSCMMRSDNLYAETSLRLFGKHRGGDGSTDDAARRETEFWRERNAPFDGVRIVDGSGLSRSNKVTARFMENILRQKHGDVEYVSFFPLAGQEGTLKKFLVGTPLDSYIAMKTGSMNGIQCYAGYKLDDDFAPTHVVVVIVNDFRCDRAYLRSQVERMLLDIFSDENITDKTFTSPRKQIQDYAE